VEFYNEYVARNPKIDMILFSQDRKPDGYNALLSKGRYPFAAAGLEAGKSRARIPTVFKHVDRRMSWFVAVDRQGNVVVEGDSDEKDIQAFIENGCKPVEG